MNFIDRINDWLTEYNTWKYGFYWLTGLLLALIFFYKCLTWIHISRGEHVGYITAVQTKGIFIRTGSAFFKTNTTSSNEYQYCVIGFGLYNKLSDYANKNEKVIITYHRQLYVAHWHCNGEKDIIDDVKIQK